MPFHSPDFERRLLDIRHWLHRRASVDFHTVHKKNIVFDTSKFPVEHDPVVKPSHEDHRMYSFALDWQQAPSDFVRSITATDKDTWESLALSLSTSVAELKRSNPECLSLTSGCRVVVPRSAVTKVTATDRRPAMFKLTDQVKTWDQAAQEMNVTVQELQAANGPALVSYKDGFDASTRELAYPTGSVPVSLEGGFATREATFVNDTYDRIAERLGTTVADLRAANVDISDPSTVSSVAVPSSASRRRRLQHPLSRTTEETSELFPSLKGVTVHRDLPSEFPTEPSVAKQHPGEFNDGVETYPVQPKPLTGVESWLAYTATYLDRELTVKTEPAIGYHWNRAWPQHAVPGSEQQTPFEEDQTWLLSAIPLQRHEIMNPKQHLQDQPQINNEHFAESIQFKRP